jgi:hypothetical protein
MSSASEPAGPEFDCAFYTVCDRRHFPGLVALLNSLRLKGHDEPLIVVDAGLTTAQRRRLTSHAHLVTAPAGEAAVLLAPLGPTTHPARVAILLDADIILTRPLHELADRASRGRLVAFVNDPPNHERSFAEWSHRLGLRPPRRQPYVNAGFLVVPEGLAARLFPLWAERQTRVPLSETRYGRAKLWDPFYFADQDVLNALLATELKSDELAILEHRLAPHPPFRGVRLDDSRRLLCRYSDGTQPFVLHHTLGKPWLTATRATVYSTLLTRLLLDSDVALPLGPNELPLRLRRGRLASVDRIRADRQAHLRAAARRQLGRFGIRTRLTTRRGRNALTRA